MTGPYHDLAGEQYARLYARWRERSNARDWIGKVLSATGYKSLANKKILDLCAGTGDSCTLAGQMGAKTLAQDGAQSMLRDYTGDKSIGVLPAWLETHYEKYDIIWCQQAINYWLDATGSYAVSRCLNPGGFFVFNTFNRKPGHEKRTQEYVFDGSTYREESFLDDAGFVRHTQMGPDGLHESAFRWIEEAQFRAWLEPYFSVRLHRDGASDFYCCRRA